MGKEMTIRNKLNSLKPELRKLVSEKKARRIIRNSITAIKTQPKLLNCSMQSIMAAVMQAGELGLEAGSLEQVYFVPFKNKIQFIIGYKGYIELLKRAGIYNIKAQAVKENDHFEYRSGTDEYIDHKQPLNNPRGEVIGAYVVAYMPDGTRKQLVIGKEEIEKHREASTTPDKYSPWVDWYEAMAKKTVLRLFAKDTGLETEEKRAMTEDYRNFTNFNDVDMNEEPKDVTPEKNKKEGKNETVKNAS